MHVAVRVALLLALVATACTTTSEDTTTSPATDSPGAGTSSAAPATTATTVDPTTPVASTLPPSDGQLRNQLGYVFPAAPAVANTGELAPEVRIDLDALWASLTATSIDVAAIEALGGSGDPRLGWLLADLLRFIQTGPVNLGLLQSFAMLTGADLGTDPVAQRSPWQSVTDHLIAWDLPAHPGYQQYKGELFTIIEPAWQPFFDDLEADIDWRHMSWGGVLIDDRSLGDQLRCPRGCIPALDDPAVTDAAGGSWYPDERIVFGVVINGEARAYPKHHMEVHEMVNDTLGGRRLGIPYCTLCGSAQVYFTDSVSADVAIPVLRTSGLLTRSNKVMYDLNTFSIFDTFTGAAVSGPLREAGIVLEQATVITSTWGEWKAAHPDTTIVAEDGGIGRVYSLDPLRGRDDAGPIFPIGNVDPRLPVQSAVVGVITPDGVPVAFPVDDLRSVLAFADTVEYGGVTIFPDAGGFVAFLSDGTPLASHEAFWFAWSQFHPDTLLWSAVGIGS